MADIAAMVNAERSALIADLVELDEEQWSVRTACDAWTVRHVVAHLTAVGNSGASSFFGGLLVSGFNFDRFTSKGLQRYNHGSNADVLSGFAETLHSTKTPPGPKYIVLGEIMCHSEDIRRSLGRHGDHREEHLVTLAEGYRLAPGPIGGRRRVRGLRLTANDIDWQTGDGPDVRGPAMDLILAMTGRLDALDSCTGEGLATMQSRC